MHFQGSSRGSGPFHPLFTWPLVTYLHVTGTILSVTPASNLMIALREDQVAK